MIIDFLELQERGFKISVVFEFQTWPRMLCNGSEVLPRLQMGVAVTGFVEDFRYSLHDS